MSSSGADDLFGRSWGSGPTGPTTPAAPGNPGPAPAGAFGAASAPGFGVAPAAGPDAGFGGVPGGAPQSTAAFAVVHPPLVWLYAAAGAGLVALVLVLVFWGVVPLAIVGWVLGGPIAIVYRPPESAAGDAFLLRVRGADNIRQVRAEGPAVRQLWKVLKDGGAVGILPDQQPKAGDGEFAPFFGTQALTMTLVSRLAERTGATVLFAWCERIGPGPDFALHVEPAPPAIADPDPIVAVTALNQAVERIARRDPAQYQWTYKRYTLRPEGSGEDNPYR